MKKLTISLTLLLILFVGSYTSVFACGHQHAEKCLVTTVDSGDKTDQTGKTDITTKIDQTAGVYQMKATDQTGAIDLAIWKDSIQIWWIGLLTTGLTW